MKNRIRIPALFLVIGLILAVIVCTGIGVAFADESDPTEDETTNPETEEPEEPEEELNEIVFDLAKGSVTFTDTSYSGYAADGSALSGDHAPANIYILTQSVATTTNYVTIGTSANQVTSDFVIYLAGINIQQSGNSDCAFSVCCKAPSLVSLILKDNTHNVLYSGKLRAGLEKSGGPASDGTLLITCETGYEEWLSDHHAGHTTHGEYNESACSDECGYLDARSPYGGEYSSCAGIGAVGSGSGGVNEPDKVAGTNALQNLTIAGGNITARSGNSTSGGGAAIGVGASSSSSNLAGTVTGLNITGGTINAIRHDDSASGVGGGYRAGYVTLNIYGGTINCGKSQFDRNSSNIRAPAVGGGGGGTSSSSPAGSIVNIYGGEIHAYGQYGSAIGAGGGGASGEGQAGFVNISGGYIEAKTEKGAGAAIGTGGSLGSGKAGAATINISGGTIITDSALGADIGGGGTGSTTASAVGGSATITISGGDITTTTGGIGGGKANAGTGGSAVINISGGTINTTSIGGGNSTTNNGGTADIFVSGDADVTLSGGIGGGNSTATNTSKNGGDANVFVSGGTLTVAGNIGGGFSAGSGKGGDASIYVTGGLLDCASIGGGTSKTGTPGSVTRDANPEGIEYTDDGAYAGVIVTGGVLKTGKIGGGTNSSNAIGFSTAYVEGGEIQGQFILANTDPAKHCFFTMTGGIVDNTELGTENYIRAQENGGAVYMSDANGVVTISGGTIKKCTGVDGGAVYMTNGEFEISGEGSIVDCTASENGGAVYLAGGKATVSGGSVSGNAAANNGGGVYVAGGEALVSGGSVSGNAATVNGGGVYVNAGTFTISGGEVGNEDTPNTAILGGGIFVYSGTANVEGGYVQYNKADSFGGGIYVSDGVVNVSDGSINNNTAVNGAGVYLPSGDFEMVGGTVTSNHATGCGGGIFLTKTPVLNGGNITENVADLDGGGIYINKQQVTLVPEGAMQISDNKAQNGGGIFISGTAEQSASFAVDDSKGGSVDISGNTAEDNGGGMCLSYGDFSLSGGAVRFFGNEAENGGAAAVLNGNFEISGGSIGGEEQDSNTAVSGGGVFVDGGSVTATGGKICHNEATYGGGVYLANGEGEFTMEGAEAMICHNNAENGGGVYLYKAPLLNQGSIHHNEATAFGGGIYIEKTEVRLSPDGTVEVTENKAKSGGALYINGTDGTDAGFSVNSSAAGTVNFTKNEADEYGGAVCINNGYFTLDSGKITVTENKAAQGGGVAVLGGICTVSGGTATVSAGTVEQNKAVTGGGIYVEKIGESESKVLISGGLVGKNTAAEDGGGAYITKGSLEMVNGEISNNSASRDGGGFYVDDGDFTMKNGTVIQNIASDGNGGGGYVAGNFLLFDGQIGANGKPNFAKNGGGIYINDGTVTMYGGKVDYNRATEDGGGLYISANEREALVDILSGSISHNGSEKDGGGVAVISTSDKAINVTVGVNADHGTITESGRSFTPFAYPEPASCGEAHTDHTNHVEDQLHSACPVIVCNNAEENGGGFFLKSPQTMLVFYCVVEDNNTAGGNKQCWNMDVQGGHVEIGDKNYDRTAEGTTANGNILMQSSILVEGGTVDVYGQMINPQFTDDITVDVKKEDDYYIDHRLYEEDDIRYKVHYNENFKGEGTVPTGLYIARQYPDDDHEELSEDERYRVTIMSSIFSHAGYKIIGWCTEQNPTVLDPDNPASGEHWYKINETYDLSQLSHDEDGMGTQVSDDFYDERLLKIYAIWERCGYVLQFESNVPNGSAYSGTMGIQTVTVGLLDGSQKLAENAFRRPGYMFTGWTLDAEGTETVYLDQQEILTDFTDEDGAIITLYAQWEECDHKDFLVYTAEGNVITESCSNCGGHHATAEISAVDCVYDGNQHPATVTYSDDWMGETLNISYEMAASDWDEKDGIDDDWTASGVRVPVHAGEYSAGIAVGEETAVCEYTISQSKWETPAVPVFVLKSTTQMQILNTNDDGVEYWMKYTKDDILHTVPCGDNKIFDLGSERIYNIYLYFSAQKTETRDYKESDKSQAEAYLYEGGNMIFVISDSGIMVNSNPAGSGGYEFSIEAAEGYHLKDYHIEMTKEYVAGVEEIYTEGIDGVILSDTPASLTEPVDYTISGLDSAHNVHVTVTITGAVRDASIAAKVTETQVFTDFNGKPTTISHDSAFTSSFTVSNYIPYEYAKQKLTFSQVLPEGTTVIMKENGHFWYYNIEDETDKIDLSYFTAMGGEIDNTFSYDVTTDAVSGPFTYQFIVDFSQTETRPAVGDLIVDLKLTPKEENNAPIVTLPENGKVNVVLKAPAQFSMTTTGTEKSASISCAYMASEGTASIWFGRKTALVLTAKTSVPSDLTMTAVTNGQSVTYTMNSEHQFIIPLSEVSSSDVELRLDSALFSSHGAESLTFDAAWYVSESGSGSSPLSGDKVSSCICTFTCKNDGTPSVRIDGTELLKKAGETLTLTVTYQGIPAGGTVIANMQSKAAGKYIDTGVKTTVASDSEGSRKITFNMGEMSAGSYRILVNVMVSGGNIMQTPYYFIITE